MRVQPGQCKQTVHVVGLAVAASGSKGYYRPASAASFLQQVRVIFNRRSTLNRRLPQQFTLRDMVWIVEGKASLHTFQCLSAFKVAGVVLDATPSAKKRRRSSSSSPGAGAAWALELSGMDYLVLYCEHMYTQSRNRRFAIAVSPPPSFFHP